MIITACQVKFMSMTAKRISLGRSLFLWGNLRINLQIETKRKIELLIYKWTSPMSLTRPVRRLNGGSINNILIQESFLFQ
jgi:hypothetical protein